MRSLIAGLMLLCMAGVATGQPKKAPSGGDADFDGILDSNDKCINEPEDLDGFEDSDGCPEMDNDNDRVEDRNDKCPNQPEDLDGFQDGDGCPDPDNDADGLRDAVDKCMNEPEDKDGFQDADGCPDPDNDNDGIVDAKDQCPNEPEDKNFIKDTDGCPDGNVAPPPPAPGLKKFCPAGLVFDETRGACIKKAVASAPPTPVPYPPIGTPPPAPATAPTGYRCGPGGKITVGKPCTCAPGRVERRDSDGVSVCAKGLAAPRP
jgi:hypothetical protein